MIGWTYGLGGSLNLCQFLEFRVGGFLKLREMLICIIGMEEENQKNFRILVITEG